MDKAIALDSNFADGYTNRGGSKLRAKDYEGALQDLNALADCNFVLISMPSNPEVLALRSSVQLPLGNKKEACSDYWKSRLK